MMDMSESDTTPVVTRQASSPRERFVNNVLMLLVLVSAAFQGSVDLGLALNRLWGLGVAASPLCIWAFAGFILGAAVLWLRLGNRYPISTALAAIMLASLPVWAFSGWAATQEGHIAVTRQLTDEQSLALERALPFPFHLQGNVVDGYEIVVARADERMQKTTDVLTQMGLAKQARHAPR